MLARHLQTLGQIRIPLTLGGFGRRVSYALGLKVIATALALVTSFLLARLLGPSGYGAYAFALAATGLLTSPAMLGMEKLIVRNVAVYTSGADWERLRGLLGWSQRSVLFTSIALGAAAVLLSIVLPWQPDPQVRVALWIGLAALPTFPLTRLRKATLQGYGCAVTSQIPELLIRPMLLLLGVGLIYNLAAVKLTAAAVVVIYALASLATLLIAGRMLRGVITPDGLMGQARRDVGVWWNAALVMLFISSVRAANVRLDTLLLCTLDGAAATGIYAIAKSGATLISFSAFAVGVPLASEAAELYAKGDLSRLQSLVNKSTAATLGLALPIGLLMIFGGRWCLLLFGEPFVAGQWCLAILSIGEIVSAACGPGALLLMMAGHERAAAAGAALTLVLLLALGAFCIPNWGMIGAAIAASCATAARAIVMAIWAQSRLGVRTVFWPAIRIA